MKIIAIKIFNALNIKNKCYVWLWIEQYQKNNTKLLNE
jgi:hypothetical protein